MTKFSRPYRLGVEWLALVGSLDGKEGLVAHVSLVAVDGCLEGIALKE